MLTYRDCFGQVTNFGTYLSFSGNIVRMKAKLTFVMLAMMMLFAAAPAYAEYAYVTGTVTDQDGVGIDAVVNASCNEHVFDGVHNTMDDNGNYFISLPNVCAVGTTVCVTATANETGYVNTGCGTMLAQGSIINIGFVDIISTPEFGLIAIPLLLSMAGFVFMKRRMI